MLEYSVLDSDGNKDYSVASSYGVVDLFWIRPLGFSQSTESGGVLLPRAGIVIEGKIDPVLLVSSVSAAVESTNSSDTQITGIVYNSQTNRIDVTTV